MADVLETLDRTADKHRDETEVEVTTPQGTQEYSVLKGHDERDVDLRSIIGWFTALAIFSILTALAMWGMFAFFLARETSKDVTPSPLFATQQQPPEPRLLPTPWEAHAQLTKEENRELEKIGLIDPKTGLAKLPPNAVNRVGNQAAPGAGTAVTSGPSLPTDWSGGRTLEPRVQ